MDIMRSAGKHRGGVELSVVKDGGVFKEMHGRSDNEETCNISVTGSKTQTNNTSKENMDKTKVVIVVLSVVVTALVVAVISIVTVSSNVYFGATDGGWTDWKDWGACSVTCGIGFTTRIRTCSNPRPSMMGHYCDGTAEQVQTCNNNSCSDGGWSDWGQWNTCTVTCGDGIRSRSRTCTSPRPSPLGKYCEGDPSEVVSCKRDVCTPTIVFKAKGATDKSPIGGQTMIFGTTLVNEGHAYNTATGIFVAPVNGTYSFSTQLCTYNEKWININIMVDGVNYAGMLVKDPKDYACNTADTVAVLHAQSKVWVKCTSADSGTVLYENSDRMNSFSGYLVHR